MIVSHEKRSCLMIKYHQSSSNRTYGEFVMQSCLFIFDSDSTSAFAIFNGDHQWLFGGYVSRVSTPRGDITWRDVMW